MAGRPSIDLRDPERRDEVRRIIRALFESEFYCGERQSLTPGERLALIKRLVEIRKASPSP